MWTDRRTEGADLPPSGMASDGQGHPIAPLVTRQWRGVESGARLWELGHQARPSGRGLRPELQSALPGTATRGPRGPFQPLAERLLSAGDPGLQDGQARPRLSRAGAHAPSGKAYLLRKGVPMTTPTLP